MYVFMLGSLSKTLAVPRPPLPTSETLGAPTPLLQSTGMALYLLFQSAYGYSLFHAYGLNRIGLESVRDCARHHTRFGKVVRLVAFHPFSTAPDALDQCNAISEGVMTEELRNFLEMNLPEVEEGKEAEFRLGVADTKVWSQISEATKIPCEINELVFELLRGVRLHFARFIMDLEPLNSENAQLGLAHSSSRAKVKFNVDQADNMIIQTIYMLDTLDRHIKTFSMRVRDWYSGNFPELVKIIDDNYLYAKLAIFLENKSNLAEDHIPELAEIVGDGNKAKQIVETAKASMEQDLSSDVQQLARRVINLSEYRKNLYEYLVTKMNRIAPNLSSLIGEVVGARLISRAGSLFNLAKHPASTLQLLGAEKALFRALRTGRNTPKYGLISRASFIRRASTRNKGRIARCLASKCSLASRIDCFSEVDNSIFGRKLLEQVEERLDSCEKGIASRKTVDAMKATVESAADDASGKDAGGVFP